MFLFCFIFFWGSLVIQYLQEPYIVLFLSGGSHGKLIGSSGNWKSLRFHTQRIRFLFFVIVCYSCMCLCV